MVNRAIAYIFSYNVDIFLCNSFGIYCGMKVWTNSMTFQVDVWVLPLNTTCSWVKYILVAENSDGGRKSAYIGVVLKDVSREMYFGLFTI
jgi:hypothetical protein